MESLSGVGNREVHSTFVEEIKSDLAEIVKTRLLIKQQHDVRWASKIELALGPDSEKVRELFFKSVNHFDKYKLDYNLFCFFHNSLKLFSRVEFHPRDFRSIFSPLE